jgi:glycosyltransferase involved in cell wall biosynthesis
VRDVRLIVHAPFIYAGGGKTLLEALLDAQAIARSGFTELLVIADRRLGAETVLRAGGTVVGWFEPTLASWLRAERTLARTVHAGDLVLCFANLPPLFKTAGFVVTYVQNTYLASTERDVRLRWRQRLPILLQRTWLRLARNHSHAFAVQTPSMRDRLAEQAGIPAARIVQLPFMEGRPFHALGAEGRAQPAWDFGYISLPWPHKNHRRLIEAFVLLAEMGLTPSLVVTVPDSMDRDLAGWIARMSERHGLHVTNLGEVPHTEVPALYRAVKALIFPSLSESFALPLLEARASGVPVLAPERDYVRDVVEPAETFDPESARSIMRAMLRFLGKAQPPPVVPGPELLLRTLHGMAQSRDGASGRGWVSHGSDA